MEKEEVGNSYLERCPLLHCDDDIIVALPTALIRTTVIHTTLA